MPRPHAPLSALCAIVALALIPTDLGAQDLPDLTAQLLTGQCASGPGNEGADSYFHGQYSLTQTALQGTETWLLYANPKWSAKGGKTCKVIWTITGSKTTDTGACGQCTYGLQVHAEPDIAASDCPEDLLLGRELPDGRRVGGEAVPFDQSYAVKAGKDQAITVYFAKSGKKLGEGYQVGEAIGYISDHQCKWF